MSQPRIWITSTRSGGDEIAEILRGRELDAFCAPLLKVVATATSHAQPTEQAALAFTSVNGVRAFCALTDQRDFQVFAVGETTASAMRSFGFSDIAVAEGNVDALSALIQERAPEYLMHYSGVHTAGDLTGALKEAGLKAERHIIYGTEAVALLPLEADQALRESHAVIIGLLSPRAAQILSRHWPDEITARVTCVSLSPAIDAALSARVKAERHIAKATLRESLISALVDAAGKT